MDRHTKKILDNLWGPTGSLIVHVLAVLVLVRFMVVERPPEGREMEVQIIEIEAPPDFEEPPEIEEEWEEVPTVVDAVAPPEVSMEREPPRVDTIAQEAADVTGLDQLDIMEATSAIQFRGLYSTRSASGRAAGLAAYSGGMGGRTEFAVMKALRWLKDHQYPDGSWGPRYKASMTGLALLAFLAHGETTDSEEFGLTVRRGLQFLVGTQRENGMFIYGGPTWGLDGPGRRLSTGQIQTYEHSIATYAVSEAYGLTQIPFLRNAMEAGIQVILDGMHAGGSWDYDYRSGPEAHIDTSLSGWHIQALKAAQMSGARNLGIDTALDASMQGLKSMATGHARGLFRYGTRLREEESDVSMTGVAVLCMQLAGYALDADARAGIQALRNVNFAWHRGENDARGVGEWPIYAWYYITQARFHQGGRTWDTWNRQFAPALCDTQNDDGSWPPAPHSREARYGPVYITALNALMLQVYYRLLPTFQEIEVQAVDPDADVPDDDIIIRFG